MYYRFFSTLTLALTLPKFLAILKDPVTYTDSPDVVGYEVVRAEFGIRLLPDKVVP